MTIQDLFRQMPSAPEIPAGLGARPITGLSYHSAKVQPGHLFFAFAGARTDGAQFAAEALAKGAVAIASEAPAPAGMEGQWIRVVHGRRALGTAAVTLHADALRAVQLLGVTGTNGKTTTAWLIDSILRSTGEQTALIGTVQYRLGDTLLPAPNTTPESIDILQLAAGLANLGGRTLIMEVSSHALELGRVHAIPFRTAIFTNLTQDHLDFHGTMENYFHAKCGLFRADRATPPATALLNADDSYASRVPLEPETTAIRFGLNQTANLRALHVEADFQGLRFDVEWQGKRMPVHTKLLGEFNVYNLLAAYGACLSLGLSREQIHAGIAAATAVPGRFERVDAGQPFAVVVDYAHTPDALINLLRSARALRPNRIITVFGCGGDRDRSKRPRMAEAAASLSDAVILTSDNPRTEDPQRILDDAAAGLRPFQTPWQEEVDRARAIQLAIGMAEPGDIVLIAGKGHETYQIFADRTIHFDDREVALHALRERGFARDKEAM